MSVFPAYPIQSSAMRPVTKITILGFRLGVVALAVYWGVIFLGTHLPAAVDVSPNVNDKVKHFAAFFGLGALMCYITTSSRYWQRFLAIAAVGMIYAAIDETTQSFVPGRVADILDFAADTAGLITAISLYVLAKYCLHRLSPDLTNSLGRD